MRYFLVVTILMGLALASVCSVPPAEALDVRVAWKRVEGAKAAEAKEKGVRQGFVEAVYQEALPLLGASFPEARAPYLREYLASHAVELVTGYSEVQFTETRAESILILDATVDKAALERLAQRVRSATPPAPIAVRLESTGATSEDEGRIAMLRKLCGIELAPDAGATLSLRREAGAWTGSLAPNVGAASVISQGVSEVAGDLEALWFGLWAKYAAGPGFPPAAQQAQGATQPPVQQPVQAPAQTPGQTPAQTPDQPGVTTISGAGQGNEAGGQALFPERSELELLVQGWTMPDGVYSLDRVFREWKAEVGAATLKTMEMKAGGVMGVWSVTILDKAGFAVRLQQYCADKGLKYSFAEETALPGQ